jgi:pimeloyl-ACP methyl ester carboxylesterase
MKQTTAGDTSRTPSETASCDVELSQGRIQYTDIGSGESILFVHGAFVNRALWRNIVDPLSQKFRCLVPTLPLGGHDMPMHEEADLTPSGLVDLLAEFVDELGLDRVILVGCDTGGALCQVFLSRYPDRVERLVLTNCDAFDNFPPALALPFVWGARIPGLTGIFARSLASRRIRRLAFGLLVKQSVRPTVLAGYVDSLVDDAGVRRDLRKALRDISPEYTQQAAASFSSFDRPVLIAWALDDPIFPLEDARQLVDRFPDARLESIEDSYALVPEDQPERLVELITNFLGVRLSV